MTCNDFCYWLQGFFELSDADSLSEKQVAEFRNQLQLLLNKKTPTLSTKSVFYTPPNAYTPFQYPSTW